jgi:hypothetical protein
MSHQLPVLTQSFTLAQQALYHLSYASSPFCSGYFGDKVSQTICQDWPQTTILPIFTSQIASITGMSHWKLAQFQQFIL